MLCHSASAAAAASSSLGSICEAVGWQLVSLAAGALPVSQLLCCLPFLRDLVVLGLAAIMQLAAGNGSLFHVTPLPAAGLA